MLYIRLYFIPTFYDIIEERVSLKRIITIKIKQDQIVLKQTRNEVKKLILNYGIIE